MNNNRCIVCNAIIPEGREICPYCEITYQKPYNRIAVTRPQLKKVLWKIIQKENIEVTNQNLDYILERAFKEFVK